MRNKLQRAAASLMAAVLLFCALPVQAAAAWTAGGGEVTIVFDANGGRGRPPAPLSGTRGTRLTLPETHLDSPMDTQGLYFAGWSFLSSAVQPDYQPGDPIFLTRDATLYAVFSREPLNTIKRPTDTPSVPAPAFTLLTEEHRKYMDGRADGLFHPAQGLTRAELAQILYNVVAERPAAGAAFSDVAQSDWYAPAVGAMAGLGILAGYEDGTFRPNQSVTREEAAAALAQLIPGASGPGRGFSDIPADHRSYEAISAVGAYGLFSGDANGSFNPNAPLLRGEAAVVLNKLMGRVPDLNALRANPDARYFPDVPTTHWAYGPIMEASISHGHTQGTNGTELWRSIQSEPTVLADGFHRIGGWLYYVSDGHFLRSATTGYFTFDAEGRYTTGDSALDLQLNALVEEKTNSSMTRDGKLRALYNYVRDDFSYLKRPLIEKGQTGWEPEYASAFLSMKKGNCFSFSALYCLLARELGQPAYTVVGKLGKNASPHGWVEIELDGVTYMFDTQLEWRYLHDYGRKGYNLFKFRPEDARFIYIK